MTEIEKLEKLFPLKVEVTQKIIDKADVEDMFNCIGALSLRSLFKKFPEKDIFWGRMDGYIYKGDYNIYLGSFSEKDEPIDMMKITSPTTVIFRQVL